MKKKVTFWCRDEQSNDQRFTKIIIQPPTRYRKGYLLHFNYTTYVYKRQGRIWINWYNSQIESGSFKIQNIEEASMLLQKLQEEFSSSQKALNRLENFFRVIFLEDLTHLPSDIIGIIEGFVDPILQQ